MNLFLNPLVHTRPTPRGASLVVSDPHSPFFIFEQALEEGEVVTVAGTGSSGLVDGAGPQFNRPFSVAMSPDGTYALDAFSKEIAKTVNQGLAVLKRRRINMESR